MEIEIQEKNQKLAVMVDLGADDQKIFFFFWFITKFWTDLSENF